MFLTNSRYAATPTVTVTTRDRREVRAVRLRRLPSPAGVRYTIARSDRLDIIAQRRYADSTRYWRVADANSELEATTLMRRPGRVVDVPET